MAMPEIDYITYLFVSHIGLHNSLYESSPNLTNYCKISI